MDKQAKIPIVSLFAARSTSYFLKLALEQKSLAIPSLYNEAKENARFFERMVKNVCAEKGGYGLQYFHRSLNSFITRHRIMFT
jgi:hypothetical protein